MRVIAVVALRMTLLVSWVCTRDSSVISFDLCIDHVQPISLLP